MKKGIVYRSTGIWHVVKSGNSFFNCRIKGKLRLENIKSTSPIVVGDEVSFNLESKKKPNQGIIVEVKKRKNYIIRKSVKLSKQVQIIASNIDQIFLIDQIEILGK